jgi:hypothetical protein
MHQNKEGLFEISAERDDTSLVTGHDENLSLLRIGCLEQAHDFSRHFWCAVLGSLGSFRTSIKKPQPEV